MIMLRLALTLSLTALPALAQDFSSNSEAKEWGLYGEQKARFEAEVVDLLCTFSGDCPDDCGAGRRQLGLLRTADDTLILPLKNAQPLFTGAATELAPYCGKLVEVDGLIVENPDTGSQNIYLIQMIREAGGEWVTTDKWTETWKAANPDATGDQPWFRQDPRVNAAIAENGYLGLGLETDKEFIDYYFGE
jgi:hypothetical protein